MECQYIIPLLTVCQWGNVISYFRGIVMEKTFFLFQLVDSAFPTGAFSHSFGLETTFQENKINKPIELYSWLKTYISGSLAPTEGVVVYLIYQAKIKEFLNQEKPEDTEKLIQRLDRKLTVSKISSETRNGGIKIGKRYLSTVHTLYPQSELIQYSRWIDDQLCFGNAAIVHGWITAYLEVEAELSVFTHLYVSINNLLQSAIRLTVIGQTAAQMILQKLYPLLMEEAERIIQSSPNEDDLFTYSIIQEIEAMRHETLYSRLFMS
ncbi:urease accessory protein UreF [Oceanobacillus zhaokaii]|uniref:Urease accessory protein UreF n=2 Tax=Oceanobacillus zhaokaii TaxID=2052660 RepID=A0A345PLW9_9BACI|nr:urease accessory protein UreF [Oceanobacillus zhaokaii]